MQPKNILCPIDFEKLSHRAADEAVAIANDSPVENPQVTFLHVHSIPAIATAQGVAAPPVPSIATRTADLAQSLRAFDHQHERPGVETKTALVTAHGSVGSAIAQYAEKHDCDLLVMCSHGRSGLKRLFMGSVAEEAMRHASIPTFIVPHA